LKAIAFVGMSEVASLNLSADSLDLPASRSFLPSSKARGPGGAHPAKKSNTAGRNSHRVAARFLMVTIECRGNIRGLKCQETHGSR
jgi:hypothetical protein